MNRQYVIVYNAGGFSDGLTYQDVQKELAISVEQHPYGGVKEFWPMYDCSPTCSASQNT